MLIAKKGLRKLQGATFDVETAFLYGKIKEDIFMRVPEGFLEVVGEIDLEQEVLKVEGSMYGLVQAAREWWNKFCTTMKAKGYSRSMAAPCLFKKQVDGKTVFVSLYVDDGYIIANSDGIDLVRKDLEESFKIKFKYGINEYVGCTIVDDGDTVYFQQPHLIKKLSETFAEELPIKVYETPFTANSNVNCEESKKEL